MTNLYLYFTNELILSEFVFGCYVCYNGFRQMFISVLYEFTCEVPPPPATPQLLLFIGASVICFDFTKPVKC